MDAPDARSPDDGAPVSRLSWLDPAAVSTRLRLWARWIGPARMMATVGAAVVIGAALWWLVRSPAPPTEARLPSATPAAAVSSADGATAGPGPTAEPAATSTAVLVDVTVHVAGAVMTPGVYTLPAGARVVDAIDAAGGARPDGDPDALNLAAPVADGDRIAVPIEGATSGAAAGGHAHAVAATVVGGPLDVNAATADELDELPGVGPATAAAIVAHREANGPFASIDELEQVRGIGPAKLDALRSLVTV